jgi:hypothetical protein
MAREKVPLQWFTRFVINAFFQYFTRTTFCLSIIFWYSLALGSRLDLGTCSWSVVAIIYIFFKLFILVIGLYYQKNKTLQKHAMLPFSEVYGKQMKAATEILCNSCVAGRKMVIVFCFCTMWSNQTDRLGEVEKRLCILATDHLSSLVVHLYLLWSFLCRFARFIRALFQSQTRKQPLWILFIWRFINH